MESHVGIICGKGPLPSHQGRLTKNLSACLPSLRPLLNLVLFGSIDRSHRRQPSDNKGFGGLWDSHIKRYQNQDSQATDTESNRGFARLPDGGTNGKTHISATNVALQDMHHDDGIQVRTDVYVDGSGRK